MTSTSDLRAAFAAYAEGKYTEAFRLFLALARDPGIAEAKYYLGLMYESGEGVASDAAEAAKWFEDYLRQLRDEAAAGKAEAQFRLGELYQHGVKVLKNDKEAVKWFTAAAEQGNADAQFHLSRLYLYGWCGLAKNDRLEDFWFQKAVNQKHPEALYCLAVRLLDASVRDDDTRAQAVQLLRESISGGFDQATELLKSIER